MSCYAARLLYLNLLYSLSTKLPTLSPLNKPNIQRIARGDTSDFNLNQPSPNTYTITISHEKRIKFVTVPQMMRCLPAIQHTTKGHTKRLTIATHAK
ncbi:MAG TPA: hypothetical protein VE732_09095 [Nitrososphaera sp.]|nr:hypothetical protein [Nitrososphaera sp.]